MVKDLCGIAKLRQQKSKDLKDAVKSLRNKYGSLRSISARLGLTWGEFQNIYYYNKVKVRTLKLIELKNCWKVVNCVNYWISTSMLSKNSLLIYSNAIGSMNKLPDVRKICKKVICCVVMTSQRI